MADGGDGYAFDACLNAQEDLNDVRAQNRREAAYIAAHLREFDDPDRIVAAASPGHSDYSIEKVEPVASLLHERKLNVQLVRYWDVGGWRLIFGVDHKPRSRRLILLAIMPRNYDYSNEQLWDRLEKDYVDFGLDYLP